MSQLRKLRRERGWPQYRLAAAANIHPATISGIESGRVIARPDELEALAKALGVDLGELIEGDD